MRNKTINLYTYIFVSFFLAAIFSAIKLPKILEIVWPQWIILVLIFWVLTLPNRVSFGLTFVIGLLLDTLSGSILGEHALALVLPIYLIIKFNNKITFNKAGGQMFLIFLLIIIYQAVLYWIHSIAKNNVAITSTYWLSSITSALVWPLLIIPLEKYARFFKRTK
jgi:rod shape-determining protein MreD